MNSESLVSSMHLIGSRELGGAEGFYCRLVNALHTRGQSVCAVNRRGSGVSRLLEPAISQVHVPFANGWDVYSAWQVARHIKREQPAVVQTYMGRATRLTRVPKKCNSIHIARLGGYYKIDGYYRHAQAWVGNTRGICDYLVKQGLPAERVYYIGNFVDTPPTFSAEWRAQLRASLGIPADAFIVFALGRFVAKKGFGDLLTAFAQMPAVVAGCPVWLMMAGDGPLRDELEQQARSLDVQSRLVWLGWQTDPHRYFDLCDVFVCPSRDEPLGNVILEAWAHGKPVVSTRTAGAVELMTDCDTGFLVDVADTRALADRMLQMLANDVSDMAAAGRAKMLSQFGVDAIVSQYTDLYRQLVRA